ncbi:MAG: FUSC family protein [Bacteroidetes bacterium]|nr:FUSC family protein [Bacteroidota bacterium]
MKRSIKKLFHFQESKAGWELPLASGLCIGFPLMAGWYFNHVGESKLVSLAGLSILYLPLSAPYLKRMLVLVLVGLGLIGSYAVGMLLSDAGLFKAVFLGVYAMVVYAFLHFIKMKRAPGAFFFVMLSVTGAFTTNTVDGAFQKTGWMAVGCLFTLCVASVFTAFMPAKNKSGASVPPPPGAHVYTTEALIFGTMMGLSVAAAMWFRLESPAWVAISCLAVLQGSSRGHVWQRSLQRFSGTVVGTALTLGLVMMQPPFWLILACITLSQIILEYLMSRNYALAVVFITILTVFLSIDSNDVLQSGYRLILYRFVDISLGCVVGAIGGWLIYHQHLKHYLSEKVGKAMTSVKAKGESHP